MNHYFFLLSFLLVACSVGPQTSVENRQPSSTSSCIKLLDIFLQAGSDSHRRIRMDSAQISELLDPTGDPTFQQRFSERTSSWISHGSNDDGINLYEIEGVGGLGLLTRALPNNPIGKKFVKMVKENAPVEELRDYLDRYFYTYFKTHFPDSTLKDLDLIYKFEVDKTLDLSTLSYEELIKMATTYIKISDAIHRSGFGNNLPAKYTMSYLQGSDDLSLESNYERLLKALETELSRRKDVDEFKNYMANWDNILGLRKSLPKYDDSTNLIERLLFNRYRSANRTERAVQDALDWDTTPEQIMGTLDSTGIQSRYSGLIDLLDYLKIKKGQHFIDLGSGYGRVGNFVGLTHPKTKVSGYEITAGRVNFSQKEAKYYRFGDRVSYQQQDLAAKNFELPQGDYFYMYDPFPDEILPKVIEKIKRASQGRRVKIIISSGWSLNIVKEFSEQSWLKKLHQLEHNSGEIYVVFETIP